MDPNDPADKTGEEHLDPVDPAPRPQAAELDPVYALTLADADKMPLLTMAGIAGQSGFFACANKEQAAIKLMFGHELGFGPCASLSGLHIVEGKPVVGSNMYASALRRHPHYDYVAKVAADDCSVSFFWVADKDDPESARRELGTYTISMVEAKERGWTVTRGGKPKTTWARHPDAMLFARAISQGTRFHCPDVFNGLTPYGEDEIEREPEHVESRVVDEEIHADALPDATDAAWQVDPAHAGHPGNVL